MSWSSVIIHTSCSQAIVGLLSDRHNQFIITADVLGFPFTPPLHSHLFTGHRRATFERCYVFVGGVRLGVWGVVLVVCVCVGVGGVVLVVCMCVTC